MDTKIRNGPDKVRNLNYFKYFLQNYHFSPSRNFGSSGDKTIVGTEFEFIEAFMADVEENEGILELEYSPSLICELILIVGNRQSKRDVRNNKLILFNFTSKHVEADLERMRIQSR